MVENKSSLFGIIALIIGASGLGVGVFSVVNFQVIEGPPGEDGIDGTGGQDGQDGQDIVGLQVGILDPDHYEIVSGLVKVRILLWNSSTCSVNVFINGTLNATSVPWVWNTTLVSDGWYNVSVKAIDTESNIAQDEIMVYVLNNPGPTPRTRVYYEGSYEVFDNIRLNFNHKSYDTTNSFDLAANGYTVPEDGTYLIMTSVFLRNFASQIRLGSIYYMINSYYHMRCSYALNPDDLLFVVDLTEIVYLSKGALVEVYINPEYEGTPYPIYIWGYSDYGYTVFSIAKLND
ncbi:MAG: hypothetical protein ACFFB0_16125 [Promethearchaeota archaeon]